MCVCAEREVSCTRRFRGHEDTRRYLGMYDIRVCKTTTGRWWWLEEKEDEYHLFLIVSLQLHYVYVFWFIKLIAVSDQGPRGTKA